MRNITVAVPDEVYRQARVAAAKQGRSLSGLVTEYLRSLSEDEAEFRRLEELQRVTQAKITRFRASDRLDRDALHDRAIR